MAARSRHYDEASSSRAFSFGLKRRQPHNRFNLERLDGRQFLDLERCIRIRRSGNRHVETALTNARDQRCKRPRPRSRRSRPRAGRYRSRDRATQQPRRPCGVARCARGAGTAAGAGDDARGAIVSTAPAICGLGSACAVRRRRTHATATPSPRRSPPPPRQPSRPSTTIATRPAPAPAPLAPAHARGTPATDRPRAATAISRSSARRHRVGVCGHP